MSVININAYECLCSSYEWVIYTAVISIKISKLYCYDLGLLQLFRSRHSKSHRVPECTEWPGYPINGFFLPWWHISGQQCQDSSGSSCERVEQEDTLVSGSMTSHFHTWIGHHRVLTLTALKVFGMCRKRLKEWFHSPVINTKSRPKIYATLDGSNTMLWHCIRLSKQCHSKFTP